jgi:hypothetical protein
MLFEDMGFFSGLTISLFYAILAVPSIILIIMYHFILIYLTTQKNIELSFLKKIIIEMGIGGLFSDL